MVMIGAKPGVEPALFGGRTLADRAFEWLEEAIIKGDYPPQTKLDEASLAKGFGISRGPVREAIRRLEGKKARRARASCRGPGRVAHGRGPDRAPVRARGARGDRVSSCLRAHDRAGLGTARGTPREARQARAAPGRRKLLPATRRLRLPFPHHPGAARTASSSRCFATISTICFASIGTGRRPERDGHRTRSPSTGPSSRRCAPATRSARSA